MKNKYCFILFLVLISSSPLPAFDHCELYIAMGSAEAVGEYDLKTGLGSILGIRLPVSKALDLEGVWRIPLALNTASPEGIIFSSGNRENTYHHLTYTTISAGASLKLEFASFRQICPFFHISFGKSWLTASERDGFSGTNTDWGAGVKYPLPHNWDLTLTYIESASYFDRLKIFGQESEMPGEIFEICRNVVLGISKNIKFGK